MTSMAQEDRQDKKLVIYRLDSIDKKLEQLDKKVDHNFVHKDTYEADKKTTDNRIDTIAEDQKYTKNLIYGVVAAVITTAIGLLISGRIFK